MAKFRFIALWLALLCIIMFALQLIIPNFTESLLLNQQSFIEPWRFITAIFLHGSLAHILYNLFALVLFGLILEKLIGSSRFLIVFFAGGIIANLVSVNFYSSSLGASGAIFGIIGAVAVLKPLMAVWAFSLPMPMFVAAILWVIGDMLGIFMPSDTANIAHLSGIAAGIILGLAFRLAIKTNKSSGHKIRIPESQMRKWEDEYVR